MSLLDNLVEAYARTDLEALFTSLEIDTSAIPNSRHEHLKAVTLGKWLYHSNRGSSALATRYFNFAGMRFRSEMEGFATPVTLGSGSNNVYCQFEDVDAFIKGYWKFLTRSVYDGWEDHTNTPENFIAYIGLKWSGSWDYVKRVLSNLPEARTKLQAAEGIEPVLPTGLTLMEAPDRVLVGDAFVITGTAPPDFFGRKLKLIIDGKYETSGPEIGEGGDWEVNFIFRQTGKRQLSIVLDNERIDLPLAVVSSLDPTPTPPEPVLGLTLGKAPDRVLVGESFTIIGTAPRDRAGQRLKIVIDGKYEASGPEIGAGGNWEVNFIFRQTGERQLSIVLDDESIDLPLAVVSSVEPEPPKPVLDLSASVGRSGVNRPNDVAAVKARLRELGFDFIGADDRRVDTGTIQAIRLFQSIIAGQPRLRGDGRIDVNGPTHRFLRASNAPRWQLMPLEGEGFINQERRQTWDNHDYGTDWMANAIANAARDYQATHRNSNPNAAPMPINDVSIPRGGDTPDHSGHETGLACDVLLPHLSGSFGVIRWWDSAYDRPATRAMLKAIRRQPLVSRVYFNDRTLIREGLCSWSWGHDSHIHFEVRPPKPI